MSIPLNNLNEFTHHFPENSIALLEKLCLSHEFEMKVRYNRLTKMGDFKESPSMRVPQITVNGDINPYAFLITFLHELAHLLVWNRYGRKVRAHGKEWKDTFANIMDPFLNPEVFPSELLSILTIHMKNPRASTHADSNLYAAIRKYNHDARYFTLLKDISENSAFKMENGKIYIKGQLRRTRFLCREFKGKRKYLIHSHAEVIPLESSHK